MHFNTAQPGVFDILKSLGPVLGIRVDGAKAKKPAALNGSGPCINAFLLGWLGGNVHGNADIYAPFSQLLFCLGQSTIGEGGAFADGGQVRNCSLGNWIRK